MWRIDILDRLCDIPTALQDISSINALELLFCKHWIISFLNFDVVIKNYSLTGFLGCFIENNESGCILNDIVLLNSLLNVICKITVDVSLHNSNHLRKFDDGELI